MATVTTTVSLVGANAAEAGRRLAAAATNVSLVSGPEPVEHELRRHERLMAEWREAQRHPPVYTVITVDPMAEVIRAWSDRLAGEDNHLETLIGLTPADPMPHYYIVSADVGEPEIHWYHGFLAGLSAMRVVTSKIDAGSLRRILADLPRGRELPDMRHVADMARDYVPLPDLTISG